MSVIAPPRPEVTDALRFVNRVRETYKLGPRLAELPRGLPQNRYQCPIARGIGACLDVRDAVQVTYGHAYISGVPDKVPLTDSAARFVALFDAGELPEFDESRCLSR